MTKGKYAARSTLRVQRTVDEHIDRLTDQLAEAKLRAKQCQRDAELVPALRQRIAELERQIEEDVVVRELVTRAEEMHEEVADIRRCFLAFREAFTDIAKRYNEAVLRMPGSNYVEWLNKRWPDLFTDSDKRFEGRASPTARKLSDEALYRLQVQDGQRFMDRDGTPLVGLERIDGKELMVGLDASLADRNSAP